MGVCESSEAAQIDYPQQWIRGRLNKNQSGPRSNLRLEILQVASICVSCGDSGALQHFRQQAASSAVKIAVGQDLVATLQQASHASDGCHPAGEAESAR